jgi:hypothetical protein
MEGLPFDFGAEDDDSDDQGDKKGSKKSKNQRAVKNLASVLSREDKSPKDQKEDKPEVDAKPEKDGSLDSDKTPELDTEAPIEHLSRVETEAINQTLASERLKEIHDIDTEGVSPETIASENFLENVESSGDVDRAFNATMTELGIEPDYEISDEETGVDDTSEIEPASAVNVLSPIPTELNENQSVNLLANSEIAVANSGPLPGTEVVAQKVVYRESSPSGTSELLVGGIVGYLVSRRRARIKSERKFAPVQKRLETEVKDLQKELVYKENHIRLLAAAKETRFKDHESKLETRPVNQELFKPHLPAENIGKVLASSEFTKLNQTEVPEQTPELTTLKAQTMRRSELLAVAQKIIIDGTTLRQIYESHLVGEKGLRRIIAVHLRGGNIKRTLKRELVEREIDFERDPGLRDQDSTKPISTGQSSIDNLLERSGIDWAENQSPTVPLNKAQGKTTVQTSRPRNNNVRRIADIVLVGVIMILATVIIALILNR